MKTTSLFSVQLAGGTFSFVMSDYPQQEFSDFVQQISLLKAKGFANIRTISYNGIRGPNNTFAGQGYTPNSSYQASVGRGRNSGRIVIAIVAALMVVILGAFVIQAATKAANTCKVRDCDDSVYMDGYCRYHYNTHKFDDAAKGVYDGLFGD